MFYDNSIDDLLNDISTFLPKNLIHGAEHLVNSYVAKKWQWSFYFSLSDIRKGIEYKDGCWYSINVMQISETTEIPDLTSYEVAYNKETPTNGISRLYQGFKENSREYTCIIITDADDSYIKYIGIKRTFKELRCNPDDLVSYMLNIEKIRNWCGDNQYKHIYEPQYWRYFNHPDFIKQMIDELKESVKVKEKSWCDDDNFYMHKDIASMDLSKARVYCYVYDFDKLLANETDVNKDDEDVLIMDMDFTVIMIDDLIIYYKTHED